MRKNHLLLALTTCATVVLSVSAADAHEAAIATDDANFGTTPAATPVAQAAPPTAEGRSSSYRASDAPIATDPPPDWAVLHAGLRPRLGTFGGIATFALAHARTERFYGGFSFSAVRNDAGTHIGLAQIALGRNLSDTFAGGYQLSLTENRARTFYGLGQTALAYNRALDIDALTQLAAYNRARSFGGVTQLGAFNRADKKFTGVVQLGVVNMIGQDIIPDGDNLAREAYVGPREDTESDHIGVFLERRPCDRLRTLPHSKVNYFHPRLHQSTGHELDALVVAIEPRFGQKNSYSRAYTFSFFHVPLSPFLN